MHVSRAFLYALSKVAEASAAWVELWVNAKSNSLSARFVWLSAAKTRSVTCGAS